MVLWRTLYLPEIQQHARYLAVELELVNNPDIRIFHRENEVDIDAWLRNRVGIEYVTNPKRISKCPRKGHCRIFTNHVEKSWQMRSTKDVTVYFQLNRAHAFGFKLLKCMGTREPLKPMLTIVLNF